MRGSQSREVWSSVAESPSDIGASVVLVRPTPTCYQVVRVTLWH